MKNGDDISIIATGGIIVDCLKAADLLKKKGVNAQSYFNAYNKTFRRVFNKRLCNKK